MHDVIIIGGGIAGLYAAYKITKISPQTKILILEKNNKKHLGGRMSVDYFKNTHIMPGAGIGRKHKDFRLMDLLHDLKIKYGEFTVSPHYADTINPVCELKKTFLMLKNKYNPIADKSKTFKEFANGLLDNSQYNQFTTCAGYTDYEDEDAYGTLFRYGFDDNYAKWTGLSIDWNVLKSKLVDVIDEKNIHCSREVSKIYYNDSYGTFTLTTTSKQEYLTKCIVMATTIDAVRKLLPGGKQKTSIYQQICGQSFLRIYGQFAKESLSIIREHLPNTTVVPGPIHKIIPMNPDNGVYMIVYSDNSDADSLKKYSENNEKNRGALCRIIEKAVGISSGSLKLNEIVSYYWNIGTHYYKPLPGDYKNRNAFIKTAQHPMSNLLVVGEMISTNQGWVEGALESVDAVVNEKWLK
jgi:DNA mismatch repair ATPase MutS